MPEDPSKLVLRLNNWRELMAGPEEFLFLGDISMECQGGANAEFPILDPDGDMAKLVGKAIHMIADGSVRHEDLENALGPELRQLVSSTLTTAEAGEPTVKHPDDPELARKVKIDASAHAILDMLRALADESGFSVVSDSFTMDMGPMGTIVTNDTTVRAFLDQFTGAALCNWWRSGNVIELRARNWYEKQSLLIPQEWLDAWRKTLKSTGALSLDDLARMAKHSMKQLKENITEGNDVLRQAGLPYIMEPGRDVLALYGALSPKQVAFLQAADGLDLRSLAPEQWELAAKMIERRSPVALRDRDAPLRLRVDGRPRQAGGSHQRDADIPNPMHYTFTLISREGEAPAESRIEWHVPIPRYKEPEPAPEKPIGQQGGSR